MSQQNLRYLTSSCTSCVFYSKYGIEHALKTQIRQYERKTSDLRYLLPALPKRVCTPSIVLDLLFIA